MKSGFRYIDEIAPADQAFEAWGDTLEELFASCGRAVFEVITDLSKVDPVESYPLEITTESLEELLYLFLSELIYLKDVGNVFFGKFDLQIETGEDFRLLGKVYGEKITPEKHVLRTDVKAVTYYQFQVKETEDGYYARVVLDL
jgi:SHS2 domain-containing protein